MVTSFAHYSRNRRRRRKLLVVYIVLPILVAAQGPISIIPYGGFDAEFITVPQNIKIDNQILNGEATNLINWSFGVRASYSINDFLDVSLEINKRPLYLFGYRIDHPAPPPSDSATKRLNVKSVDWTTAVSLKRRLFSFRAFQVNAVVGTGVSKFFESGKGVVKQVPPDFGPGYEATTELYRTLYQSRIRPAWVGMVGTEISYWILSLELRYLKTLSRSVTNPIEFRGDTYSNQNKRDSIQLLLGIRYMLGN